MKIKRKGVSPVVGVSILTMMALAAAFTAYSFIDSTMSDIQGNTDDRLTEQELTENSRIGIDTAYKDTSESPPKIDLVVRNTGEYYVNFTNWEWYKDGEPASSDITTTLTDGFDPQETKTIETSIEFPTAPDTKVIEIQGEYVSASITCNPGGNRC